jgi:hypothetical protein
MKNFFLIFLAFFLFLFWGCATPGQKFIDITYKAGHEKTGTGVIGIAPFQDRRKDMGEGYVGYRVLMDNSQETYFVNGMNLAETLRKAIAGYFENSGYTVKPIDPWEPTTEGVMNASEGFQQIVSGQINQFECRANKEGFTTKMVLDIDLIFYIGQSEKNALKTIPVALTLERTELTFSREKLEEFINQSLKEVIQKAMVF